MNEDRASPSRLLDVSFAALSPFLGRERARRAAGYGYAVWTLLTHALRAQHGKAVLGMAWTLLVPLLFIAVYVPVMATAGISKEVERVLGPGPFGFAIYVVSGFITWNAFSHSLQAGAACLVNNPNVVHHSPIPLSVIPLVKVLTALVTWCIGIFCILAFLAAVGRWPGIRVLLLLPLLLAWALFLHGLALLLSSLAVFFQDLLQIISTLLLVQFFAVPILYLPTSLPRHLVPFMEANPLTPFLTLTHALVLPEASLTWQDIGLAVGWSIGLYFVGRWVFERLQPALPDHI